MLKNEKKSEDNKIETVSDSKKLDKEITARLNEELREECFVNDQFQNDEEKIEYGESTFQMKKVIKIMHDRKETTPWKNYKKDFKKAFGPKDKLNEKTAIEKW